LTEDPARAASRDRLSAGRVGRPHGLDGSFYVTEAKPPLLTVGTEVQVGDRTVRISRRAGTDARPIVALESCHDRPAAEALRGQDLLVPRSDAPELEADEWWIEDLEGCAVRDGERQVGTVRRVMELPSCDVLEVERGRGEADLLVPLIDDAVREVDVERRVIDVDLAFLQGS
jgi:16S rRNA processing protein RimM